MVKLAAGRFTQTLKHLEGDGFVVRHAPVVVPPHVEYSFTPLGLEVAERVRLLADWIEVNLGHVLKSWDPEALPVYPQQTVA